MFSYAIPLVLNSSDGNTMLLPSTAIPTTDELGYFKTSCTTSPAYVKEVSSDIHVIKIICTW